ncbi:MAG: F390 synthetase-related protein [Pseudomonadota bacterium]
MSLVQALKTYAHVRTVPWRFADRSALTAWQERRLQAWLAQDVPGVAAFARPVSTLSELPVMEKTDLMEDFSRYNKAGVTNEAGWGAFAGEKQIGDLIVGASTGTSGNRGLFVISQRERFAWLGAILAKCLPDFWRMRDRVAILLPVNTPLYDSANRTRALRLQFFDIGAPFAEITAQLERFDPTVIVAPPRILRRLAEAGSALNPRKIFAGSETLDPVDRSPIEAGFGLRLGQIYMATEGLLATTCDHGSLHLAEDCMHFELEPKSGGLVTPIISDFNRRTQIMARYRMNDLLRLSDEPCICGSPLRRVAEVVGRQDDVFELGGIEVTPDVLRNAVVDADRAISDFALAQVSARTVELGLAETLAASAREAARAAVLDAIQRKGACADVRLTPLADHRPGKLRRVRRDWKG